MKHIKKFLALALVAITILAVAVPAMAETGTYNTAAVHLRSSPGGSSLGLVSKGATCDILERRTISSVLWYRVKITSHTLNSPDLFGRTGWSQARFINSSEGGSRPTNPPASGNIVNGHIKLNNGFVFVRSGPGKNTSTVGQLKNRHQIVYDTYKHNSSGSDGYLWNKITYPFSGYVASNYVYAGGNAGGSSPNNPKCTRCGAIMHASRYISHTYNQNQGQSVFDNGQLRIWYPATARFSYTCTSHPTPSNQVMDGLAVSGYVWSDTPTQFYQGAGPRP